MSFFPLRPWWLFAQMYVAATQAENKSNPVNVHITTELVHVFIHWSLYMLYDMRGFNNLEKVYLDIDIIYATATSKATRLSSLLRSELNLIFFQLFRCDRSRCIRHEFFSCR